MGDRKRMTRRAGLALIGTGVAVAIPYTQGTSTMVANRGTNVETATDSNALLGIEGIGQSPRDQITLTNNTDSVLEVTVTTTHFRISRSGSGQATFTIGSGGTREIEFSPESASQDQVAFDATMLDAGSPEGSIQLQRSIAIPTPPEDGTTYYIRNVHSGLYLTGDAPTGFWIWFDPGDVYQATLQDDSSSQRWTVQRSGGSTVLQHASSGANLAVGSAEDSNELEEVVTSAQTYPDTDSWNLVENEDGSYRIENVANPGDVVDVSDGSTEADANVISYPWKGNDAAVANQKWIFEPV